MPHQYFYSNGIQINHLGIEDNHELREAEYTLTAINMRRMMCGELQLKASKYDLELLKEIHKHLFGDIYAWAGEIRTVKIAKDIDYELTSVFADPVEIVPKWQELEQCIALLIESDYLSQEEKNRALVDIFVDMNHIHAFYRGNGRAQLFFISLLAHRLDINLDFSLFAANTEEQE